MAIHIHCPACHKRLETTGAACPHCNAALPPGVLQTLSMALGKTPMPAPHWSPGPVPAHVTRPPTAVAAGSPAAGSPMPKHHSTMRPWLAATLSLLCGLGQLYNGQGVKGLILLLGGALIVASIITWQSPVAFVLAPLLWLYAIVDAYLVARRG